MAPDPTSGLVPWHRKIKTELAIDKGTVSGPADGKEAGFNWTNTLTLPLTPISCAPVYPCYPSALRRYKNNDIERGKNMYLLISFRCIVLLYISTLSLSSKHRLKTLHKPLHIFKPAIQRHWRHCNYPRLPHITDHTPPPPAPYLLPRLRNICTSVLQQLYYNVLYKRASHISELAIFHHPTITILNYPTTTLGNNNNWTRNRWIRRFCSLFTSACIMARLTAHTIILNLRTRPLYITTTLSCFLS
jgi:hypothetical protein